MGCGLEGVLGSGPSQLTGIVNGVDYSDLESGDRSAPGRRNTTSPTGKPARPPAKPPCSASWACPSCRARRIVAIIGRLADQKGWDLVADVMRRWAPNMDAQWVILGTGEPYYHDLLGELPRQFPQRVAARLEFSDPLAHRIEAGADIFLMPSRYEPCGLNQLYSLKYGTVPVVRATGGLVDTVTDASPDSLAAGTATGFVFEAYNASVLEATLHRAIDTYWQQPAGLATTGGDRHAAGLVVDGECQAVCRGLHPGRLAAPGRTRTIEAPAVTADRPMSEYRQDPLSRRWVIIGGERAGRPNEYIDPPPSRQPFPCPFCAGNERQTPDADCRL